MKKNHANGMVWSPGPLSFVYYIKTIFFNYFIALFAEIPINLQFQLLLDYHFFDSNMTLLKKINIFLDILRSYNVNFLLDLRQILKRFKMRFEHHNYLNIEVDIINSNIKKNNN